MLLIVCACFFASTGVIAGDSLASVVEAETGVEFPSEIQFIQDSESYTLQLTGVTARQKWFFNVYAIANYLQKGEDTDDLDSKKILTDGLAKQITIQYVRNVSPNKITDALKEDFELNTTPSEYLEIEKYVEQMMNYFVRPVKKGEVFVMRWLSGGRVYLELNNKKLGNVKSELFARSLWAIWFGEHPVVDSEELMIK